uniref:CUB domain-containing protein n=1 Tax=Romanomermis culicivorax TaxID=13658 RepID=A0A915K1I8_ROMCU
MELMVDKNAIKCQPEVKYGGGFQVNPMLNSTLILDVLTFPNIPKLNMAFFVIFIVWSSIWAETLCNGSDNLIDDHDKIGWKTTNESDDNGLFSDAADKCTTDEEIFLNDTMSVKYLTPPGYPNTSYPNVECMWTITRGHEERCTFGYVEIGLGLRESKFKNDSHYVRVRICSDLKANKTFQSIANRIYIRYVSKPYLTTIDRWGEIRGFRLEYSLMKDARYSSEFGERKKSTNSTDFERKNTGGGVPSVVIVLLLFTFGVIPTSFCLFYVWRSKKRSQFTLHTSDNKVVPRIVVQRRRGSSASSIVENSGGPFLNVTLDLNDMSLHSFSIHSDNSAVNLHTDPPSQHQDAKLHPDHNNR